MRVIFLFLAIVCLFFFTGCAGSRALEQELDDQAVEQPASEQKDKEIKKRRTRSIYVLERYDGQTYTDVFKVEKRIPEEIFKFSRKKQLVFYRHKGFYKVYYIDYPRLISAKAYSFEELLDMESDGAYPQKIIEELLGK
ncbi:hypothetical protein C0584_06090 [Candidatus Parcubacteria bacterium]|nr:MAG: hypothetical protein C0584_06090 [Candidatus Parcubacteria bacterium]